MEPESRTSIGLYGIGETWQTTDNVLPDSLSCHQPTVYGDDEPLIPEDWIKDVASIHPASENWICFALSDGAGGWAHKWCRGHDVICTLQKLKESPDFLTRNIYVSQLSFSERKRKVNSVAAMNVSFLDLDGKLAKNQEPEEWREVVLSHCRQYDIPEPNDMVFTGNGIHVKWIYTQPASRKQLARWSHIERLLFTQFETLGADEKALDAARVLRVPGTVNCKPGTKDNRVRVIHHSQAAYTFDEFAAKVEASIPVNAGSFKACMEEWEKSRKATKPEPETKFQICPVSNEDLNRQQNAESGLDAACISRSFVVLSRCPSATVEEKIENIRRHCREYRDVGIPEPNRYITVGDTIIAEWSYDKIPLYVSSRWEVTQEFLCRHFECWGAMDNPENLKATAYLPLPGFKGADGETAKLAYHASEVQQYSFDKLARAVLHFSQKAVKEYKAEKAEEKARKRMERKPKIWNSRDFTHVARRRYHDILHLLELRKDGSGNVRQGCREKCVFWAMNFAIQAGEVMPLNFDSNAQSLIDFCGPRFRSECGVRVLTTLKRKLEKGEKTYHATDRKLIKELCITEEEQHEMLTLRAVKQRKDKKERIPRQKWLAEHPQERNKPWEAEGVCRSKFFKDRKIAREAAERTRRWRAAQRQRAAQWIKARQAQRIKTNQRWGLRKYILRGQVLPYIMMRASKKSLSKYRYRVKGRFRRMERGP